jgi:DNA-binding NarL/FixJ family response regulator
MAELRIFIADDHAIVREGLKALVNAEPGMRVVGEAADGREAYRGIVQLRPDVAVMDISMPGWSGSEATSRLRRDCPGIRVVSLTVHEDESYLRGLLEAGAAGYVLKRSATADLIHAIRTVAAGGTYIDPNLAGRLVNVYIDSHPVCPPTSRGELTGRESDVVRLIALGHSNKATGGWKSPRNRAILPYRMMHASWSVIVSRRTGSLGWMTPSSATTP